MDAEKQYYYLNKTQETLGPKTLEQLREMCAKGEVSGDTLIAAIGDPRWVRLAAALDGAALAATPIDGEAGVCPRCGATLQTAGGALPESCPACSFAVDSPHDTVNLFAHFRFALTKKYCCFRGRATRVEFWSFALFSWLILTAISYIVGAIRGTLLGAAQIQAELESMAEHVNSPEQLPAFFNKFLEAFGILQPDGVSSSAYGVALVLLSLQYAVQFAFLLPSWGVSVRRLHDVGWSGWWYGVFVVLQGFFYAAMGLVSYDFFHLNAEEMAADEMVSLCPSLIPLLALGVPLAALSVLLFVLFLLDSKRGPNKYGPSPKYPLG